ncbi:MAG: hypothetical protein J0H74_33065 [Chitinophagaceae bacterium]|nr:hypothetical protein [Chitinophagaceae bacterium]
MVRDRRYKNVKNLISGGYVTSFREIFDIIPKTVVARDLGMNNNRFSELMANVEKFVLKDLFLIASFIDIDEKTLINLILQQHQLDKKIKKKKP